MATLLKKESHKNCSHLYSYLLRKGSTQTHVENDEGASAAHAGAAMDDDGWVVLLPGHRSVPLNLLQEGDDRTRVGGHAVVWPGRVVQVLDLGLRNFYEF